MITEIISLVIALLAVIISPIISYRIAKQNLEFQFRTLLQENWLNKLVENSHSFLHFTNEWIEKFRGLKDGSSRNENPNVEIDRLFDGINSSIIKLHLLLEQNKPEQKSILDKINQMKFIINTQNFDEKSINDLRDLYDLIINELTNLFKKERSKILKTFR